MFGWFCPRRCDSTGGKVFTGFILNDDPESEEAGNFDVRVGLAGHLSIYNTPSND